MWNRDTLRQICVRLDDVTLQKMTESWRLWQEVTALLGDNLFWMERAQHLTGLSLRTGPSYDWVEIYYDLLQSQENAPGERHPELGVFEEVYRQGLKHADTLIVLFDIYGVPLKPAPRPITLDRCGWITSELVLRVLISRGFIVYDEEILRRHIMEVSRDDNNTEIVQYLLSSLKMKAVLDDIPVIQAAREGRMNIVKVFLADKRYATERTLESVLDAAISGGQVEIAKYMLETYKFGMYVLQEAALSSISFGKTAVFELLLSNAGFNLAQKELFFENSLHRGLIDVTRLLLASGVRNRNTTFWRQELNNAIGHAHLATVKLCLEHVSPATKGNQALKVAASTLAKAKAAPHTNVAAAQHGEEVLSILLADPRTDPNADVKGVLLAGTLALAKNKRMTEKIESIPALYGDALSLLSDDSKEFYVPKKEDSIVADMLARDKKLDVEGMELGTLRLFLWALHYPYVDDSVSARSPIDDSGSARSPIDDSGSARSPIDDSGSARSSVDDRLDGFSDGAMLASDRDQGREAVSLILEQGRDLFSQLVRQIVFRRPTGVELCDWLIAKNDNRAVQAARSVLRDETSQDAEVRVVAGLLRIVLYPTLSLKRLLADVDQSDKKRVGQLVGVYLGRAGLRAREQL